MARLDVEGLRVAFPGAARPAVDGISFALASGEALALVGASGSGKTLTLLALLGLAPPAAEVGGRIALDGEVLCGEAAFRRIRGRRLGMVFQEPLAALTPHLAVGEAVAEVARHHLGLSGVAARARAVELLAAVELPEPAELARRRPHELSGGMRQRVAIAAALAGEPAFLLADEPTTALDAPVQASILALLGRLRRERGLGLVLVSHDLAVVGAACDRVAVVLGGRIVETGPVAAVLASPRHPYAAALVDPERGAALGFDEVPGSDGGCPLRTRCPRAVPACAEAPALTATGPDRWVACRAPLAAGEAA